MSEEHISEHERKERERQEKERQHALEQKKREQKRKLKKASKWLFIVLVIAGIGYWSFQSYKNAPKPYVDKPIHWHPILSIKINGENIAIPANIGIGGKYSKSPFFISGMGMTGIHTHDASGTLHWEDPRRPFEKDLYIGNFFDIWGKTFNSTCIFEYCNEGNKTVKMFVNGKQNFDYEKYIIYDKDKIEIIYE